MTNEEKTISILQKFGVLPKNYTDFELEYTKNHMEWAMLMKLAECKDEQIKKILITISSFKDIKNIKGYVNETYKAITGKNIKLPKCMEEEECHESVQMKLKDAQFAEERKALIDKACEWLKRELAEPMPDEMYKKWCDEKLVDFCKIMDE